MAYSYHGLSPLKAQPTSFSHDRFPYSTFPDTITRHVVKDFQLPLTSWRNSMLDSFLSLSMYVCMYVCNVLLLCISIGKLLLEVQHN